VATDMPVDLEIWKSIMPRDNSNAQWECSRLGRNDVKVKAVSILSPGWQQQKAW